MLSSIHQTPEEKLTLASQKTALTVSENVGKSDEIVQVLKEIGGAVKDHSVEIAGFTHLINSTLQLDSKLDEISSLEFEGNTILEKIAGKDFQLEVKLADVDLVSIKGDTGLQGKQGIQGVQGKQGVAGKDGKDGADGKTGAKGERGLTGLKGKNGRDGTDGKDGTDAPIHSPNETIELINQAEKKIDANRINGLLAMQKFIDEYGTHPQGMGAGGSQPIVFLSNGVRVSDFVTEINLSSGLTPVYSGNGRITITGTSSVITYSETPTGTIDGANVTFTTAHTITTVLNFALNGMYIHPTTDYTFSGSTITFTTAPDASLSGLPFTIVYV